MFEHVLALKMGLATFDKNKLQISLEKISKMHHKLLECSRLYVERSQFLPKSQFDKSGFRHILALTISILPELFHQILIHFFSSVLRPFQDYFSSYEKGQSVSGAKTGES